MRALSEPFGTTFERDGESLGLALGDCHAVGCLGRAG